MSGKITVWQRAVLMLMVAQYRYHASVAFGEPLDWELRVTRRAIEHCLWFDWQPYHTKAMEKLIGLHWIEQVNTPAGLIAYRLTRAAYVVLDDCYSQFIDHTIVKWDSTVVPAGQQQALALGDDNELADIFAIPRP